MCLLILYSKDQENKKTVRNIEQNTKHAARATQIERQIDSFVLTLFSFEAPNYVLARTLTERVV